MRLLKYIFGRQHSLCFVFICTPCYIYFAGGTAQRNQGQKLIRVMFVTTTGVEGLEPGKQLKTRRTYLVEDLMVLVELPKRARNTTRSAFELRLRGGPLQRIGRQICIGGFWIQRNGLTDVSYMVKTEQSRQRHELVVDGRRTNGRIWGTSVFWEKRWTKEGRAHTPHGSMVQNPTLNSMHNSTRNSLFVTQTFVVASNGTPSCCFFS